jgi:hypothetical protein
MLTACNLYQSQIPTYYSLGGESDPEGRHKTLLNRQDLKKARKLAASVRQYYCEVGLYLARHRDFESELADFTGKLRGFARRHHMGTETVNQWQQRLALGLEHPSSSGRSWAPDMLAFLRHKAGVPVHQDLTVLGNAACNLVLDRLKQQMVRGRTCCS